MVATFYILELRQKKQDKINYEDTVTAKNYFEKMTINLSDKTVKRDNTETTLQEEFGMPEEQVNLILTSQEELDNYFGNSTFEVDKKENIVTLKNPYQTKTLLVEASEIEDNFDALEETSVQEGLYILKYDTQKRTKAAYEYLKEQEGINEVQPDEVCIIETINDESQTLYGEDEEKDKEKYNTHGIAAMGIDNYKKIIEDNGNPSDVIVATIGYGAKIDSGYFRDRISEEYLNFIGEDSKDIHETIPQGSRTLEVIKEATTDNVKLMPLVVINDENYTTTSCIIRAINYAVEKADVICYEFVNKQNYMIELALKNAFSKNVPICCVTKSVKEDEQIFPANNAYTIAVSSVDKSQNTTSYSGSGEYLDFVASSTDVKEIFDTSSSVSKWSGAEYSNAHVVSIIALIKTYNKEFTILEVYNTIRNYCQDLGDEGKDNTYGYGFPEFSKIKISDIDKQAPELEATLDDTEWEKSKNVQIKATDNIRIYGWNVTDSDKVPDKWEKMDSKTNTLETSKEINKNGTHYIWVTDSAGNVTYKSIEVTKIDTTPPEITIATDESRQETEKLVTITASATDEGIGLHDMPYSWDKQNWGTDNTSLNVTKNGTYKVYVRDKLENIAEKTVTIRSFPQEGTADLDSGSIIKSIEVSSNWEGNKNKEVTIIFNNNLNIDRWKITKSDNVPQEFVETEAEPEQNNNTDENATNTTEENTTTNTTNTTNTASNTSSSDSSLEGYTNLTVTVSLNANRKYYMWIKDVDGNIISQGFTIRKVN